MSDTFVEGTFLGLPALDGGADVTVVPLAFELTTSYGTGTEGGPSACIEASGQVELYDDALGEALPAGAVLHTADVWEGSASTLRGQLDELSDHVRPFFNGQQFPLFLGGEHGILPPVLHAARAHPLVQGDLTKVTVVQLDAHADLRSSLEGEVFSHACAAARSLDVGIGALYQAGVRAYCKEEADRIESDSRISTFFAKDTQHPHTGGPVWQSWIEALRALEGPVHFTLDIDGLDGSLVPATGTPVPGGLSYWQAVETIETLFGNPNAVVISADVNEISPQADTPLTQFTAACLATKIIASHLLAKREGRWKASSAPLRSEGQCTFFSDYDEKTHSAS